MIPSRHQKSLLAAATVAGEEKRRTQRVIIRVPVTLGMIENGKAERIVAHTVAVNLHGAMVICPRNLDPETKLELLNERTRQKANARVSRAPRECPEGFLIPLEFTVPSANFWQISFPPSTWKPSDS